MPSEKDRQDAQAARAESLRWLDDKPADTAESVQADGYVLSDDPVIRADQEDNPDDFRAPDPEPAVQISASFVPEGLEVVIQIPHEGITINLPEPPADGSPEA